MHRRLSLPALAFLIGLTVAGAARAQVLPPAAAPLVPQVREAGQGRLTWWGLHIYDARLYVSGPAFRAGEPFALALRYARDFEGQRIADTSVEEMRRLGFGNETDQRRWRDAMLALFPDVKRGDELIGVSVPGRGAVFFHNGRRIGEVDDPGFARAFFAIWLDPRTRAAELRQRLLGEAG
jgi:hypothetical protein